MYEGQMSAYLNIRGAKRSDTVDLGSRDARSLQSQHGLEVVLQLCYSGGHGGRVSQKER